MSDAEQSFIDAFTGTKAPASVTTDKAISLHDLAAELGEGVVLSCIGLPHAHPVTGEVETCTIYVDPASPMHPAQAQLEAAVAAHVAPGT